MAAVAAAVGVGAALAVKPAVGRGAVIEDNQLPWAGPLGVMVAVAAAVSKPLIAIGAAAKVRK